MPAALIWAAALLLLALRDSAAARSISLVSTSKSAATRSAAPQEAVGVPVELGGKLLSTTSASIATDAQLEEEQAAAKTAAAGALLADSDPADTKESV